MNWFRAPATTIPGLIELHARWRGQRAAAIEGDRRFTWREFGEETARVANGLGALALKPGDRVALLMDSSLDMLALLFGILRAGLSAVPLNVSVSDDAVAGMIADAGAAALFVSSAHVKRIEKLIPHVGAVAHCIRVALDEEASGFIAYRRWIAAQPTGYQSRVQPADECNIIYSSGTTGVPKGIVHTHASRLSWAADLAVALRYRSDCVTLLSLGLFSNISWVAMLCTIYVGGTMVLMSHFEARETLALIAREKISHAAVVPLQLKRLLAQPASECDAFGSLDTWMCCGSPLDLEVKREFPKRFNMNLIELYGLTEGLCTILAPEDFKSKTASVGKPFLGTDLKIIDQFGREAPCGETGEVVGLSPLLMAGYHGNEPASRDATWEDVDGARWLRTGDLGRLDADGFLYIVDRKKDMILSGGQNIYPADIEAVMTAHPGIADVAVVGVENAEWGETPVAVIVRQAGATLSAEEVLTWTNERVGRQQRVRAAVFKEALPRNPNGKVLKRELKAQLKGLKL
ncbi:MAG TPA: AMP-binding protein [Steroidobacteraceae bacterium]